MWRVLIRGLQRLQVLRNLSQRQGLRDPRDFQVLKHGCSNLLMLRELFQGLTASGFRRISHQPSAAKFHRQQPFPQAVCLAILLTVLQS